jgi:hypothetical protein
MEKTLKHLQIMKEEADILQSAQTEVEIQKVIEESRRTMEEVARIVVPSRSNKDYSQLSFW